MKRITTKLFLILLMALMVPVTATAAYEQLADGVYQDATTLYITSGVTSLGDLQVNPSEIYCYATIPPACVTNTFTGYDATLHVPAAGMVSYFTALYWYNFNNILSDAIEPLSVTMNTNDAEMEIGQQLSLSTTVAPGGATPKTVYWSSTDTSVASVSASGTVTTVAVGECDILAACVDKVAVCHVTVMPPRVTITLDKHEAQLLPNHTMTLTASCSPVDVDLSVTSSNLGVAIPRLVNGTIMVVGVAEGTATITVNAADGWGNPDTCEITVYTEHGDVNCDGYVNISDVTKLIDFLLSDNPEGLSINNADTNRDGNVNISDVTALIDYLLSERWPWSEPELEEFTVNGVTFTMVSVEGGSFSMGNDSGIPWEQPAHEVTLSSYKIGQTEVTQALWQTVMGSNPSYFTGDLTRPVEQLSWNDCQSFVYKLNEMTGKHFRLPTEAEWEYAARGGKRSKGYIYSGSNNVDEVAWSNNPNGNSSFSDGSPTYSVGTKKGNELGILDMTGNVWEYVQDWWDSYSSNVQINPMGPAYTSTHVIRGGCVWTMYASDMEYRVSYRNSYNPSESNRYIGFRLALDVDNSPKFRFSESVVTVEVGKSKSVTILNGDGNYVVADGTNNFSSSINGNILTVTGTIEGTTTVHVTNISTGAVAVLTVIVINPNVVDGHGYVDLGLPSGTLWATCNVGASAPEEYGDYFAWGETAPKEIYNWSTYKWCNGSETKLKKYCTKSSYGSVDNKTQLETTDDAAYVNWGPSWRMPSKAQQDELCEKCTWIWTTHNAVNGRLVIGPNGNTMFLPAAGGRSDDSLFYVGSGGYYMSRTLCSEYPSRAYCIYFNSSDLLWNCVSDRFNGYNVRAVLN